MNQKGRSDLHTNFRISVEVDGPTYDVECMIHIVVLVLGVGTRCPFELTVYRL
jgi:hypothetical protein